VIIPVNQTRILLATRSSRCKEREGRGRSFNSATRIEGAGERRRSVTERERRLSYFRYSSKRKEMKGAAEKDGGGKEIKDYGNLTQHSFCKGAQGSTAQQLGEREKAGHANEVCSNGELKE